MAFGGAGPMHAAFIAEELEIAHVVVPLRPGNFCAFGALISDIRHDHLRTHRVELSSADAGTLEMAFAAMEEEAREGMTAEGMPRSRIAMLRSAGMRYLGQAWDLVVRLPGSVTDLKKIEMLFHEAHQKRYGYRSNDPVEIVSLRVSAIGEVAKPTLPEWSQVGSLEAARRETRQVYFGRMQAVPVYLRDKMPHNARVEGPAIVEEMGAVTVVPPGWRLEVGRLGELHVLRGEGK
jgi:N-methylhydantoinase A